MYWYGNRKYEGELVSIPTETALNTVFIDLIGPLPYSKLQNAYILVCDDGFTKYVWLSAIKNCTSQLIRNKLEHTFLKLWHA